VYDYVILRSNKHKHHVTKKQKNKNRSVLNKKCKKVLKNGKKKKKVKTGNRSVLIKSRFGSFFNISVRFFGLKPNRRHH